MKKNYLKVTAILLALFTIVFSSCDKDDDPTPVREISNMYKIGTTTYTTNKETKTVTINDRGEGTGTRTLSADTVWILEGFVFVANGQTLTIEPGTMIQGKPGQAENASALIVKQGGKIMAEGTAEKPIVFTGLGDTYTGENGYMKQIQGLWGGLIILGKATTNNSVQKRIEGVPEEYSAFYGGNNDNDNSGVLKYVSIRHGGTDIGAGNEINGLTLGGVGNGTVIDYIEVISNVDDGVEFFGGAPNLKHILVAFCGDDSYDYDEGFHGKGQFWVTIQSESSGDRLGEHDGGDGDDETATPYAKPIIYNATYIGNGNGKVITFRDNAGGVYANSIFASQSKGIDVEFRDDKANSLDQLVSKDNLDIKNCLFNQVANQTIAKALTVSEVEGHGTAPSTTASTLASHFSDNSNSISSLNTVGFNNGNHLLIPATGEANNGVAPTDDWFNNVTYQGAFAPGGNNWAQGWTLTFASN
ncbi:MAG: hypothetical protein MI739_00145 [Bacteroidales bacterium]|nr:hypothetical protein [Bacteroidales bacterium]